MTAKYLAYDNQLRMLINKRLSVYCSFMGLIEAQNFYLLARTAHPTLSFQ